MFYSSTSQPACRGAGYGAAPLKFSFHVMFAAMDETLDGDDDVTFLEEMRPPKMRFFPAVLEKQLPVAQTDCLLFPAVSTCHAAAAPAAAAPLCLPALPMQCYTAHWPRPAPTTAMAMPCLFKPALCHKGSCCCFCCFSLPVLSPI